MKRKIRLSFRRPNDERQDCPLVRIQVRSGHADLVIVSFCIDTGADFSALPLSLALKEKITVQRSEANRGIAAGLVGKVNRYRGMLPVRLFGENFTWPCDFLDSAGPTSVKQYGVIGRAGFLDDFAFCLDRPYFTLRRRYSGWRWLTAALLPPWTTRHEPDQPL